MKAQTRKHQRSPFATLIALLFAAFPLSVNAQNSDSGQGVAQAEVVKPLSAIPLADLSFGSIAVGRDVPGQVRVAPDGGPAAYFNSARAQCSGQVDCAPHRASFEVVGEANRTYRVSLPRFVTARGANTGAQLVVDELEVRSLNYPGAADGGWLDAEGRDLFFVGGTVNIPARTATDTFRAQLPITVSYN